MKMHRLIFGLLLQIFIGGAVTADQLPIKRYTIADGLARDTVNCLVHDSHGFLWFCTPAGLSRFDGYGFTNYGMADGLPSRYVNHFVERRRTPDFAATGTNRSIQFGWTRGGSVPAGR